MANWTSLSSAEIIVIFKDIYATKNAAFYSYISYSEHFVQHYFENVLSKS